MSGALNNAIRAIANLDPGAQETLATLMCIRANDTPTRSRATVTSLVSLARGIIGVERAEPAESATQDILHEPDRPTESRTVIQRG